jgi:hypothetical protein
MFSLVNLTKTYLDIQFNFYHNFWKGCSPAALRGELPPTGIYQHRARISLKLFLMTK